MHAAALSQVNGISPSSRNGLSMIECLQDQSLSSEQTQQEKDSLYQHAREMGLEDVWRFLDLFRSR
jgi:hypothetical protein